MQILKYFQLAVLGSSLILGMTSFVNNANAASAFEKRFMRACKSDDNSSKACKCQYRKLKKPKNKNQEELVIAMLKDDDAKVEAMINKDASLRMISIINSMTRGLVTCGF